jgi:hypothetical protein
LESFQSINISSDKKETSEDLFEIFSPFEIVARMVWVNDQVCIDMLNLSGVRDCFEAVVLNSRMVLRNMILA